MKHVIVVLSNDKELWVYEDRIVVLLNGVQIMEFKL